MAAFVEVAMKLPLAPPPPPRSKPNFFGCSKTKGDKNNVTLVSALDRSFCG